MSLKDSAELTRSIVGLTDTFTLPLIFFLLYTEYFILQLKQYIIYYYYLLYFIYLNFSLVNMVYYLKKEMINDLKLYVNHLTVFPVKSTVK